MKSPLIIFALCIGLLQISCKQPEPDVVNGFTIPSTTLNENDAANLTVNLNGTINAPISVSYEVREGTAKFDTDVKSQSGELSFDPDNTTAQLAIELIDDSHFELSESFEVVLSYDGRSWNTAILLSDDDQIGPAQRDGEGYITPESYPSMELIWQDEFDGTSLNTTDWTFEYGNGCDKGLCGWGNNELQLYTDEEANIKLENGRMTITAREDNGTYTSTRIITQDKVEVRFGRIDIRAKMPKGQGIWPALWMLGANIDDVSWPMCGEIDIMELVGHEPATTHGTVHYDDSGYKYNGNSKTLSTGDLSDEFHVYSIVWDRDVIHWYLDNEWFKTFEKRNIGTYPFNDAFFFIMNIAVGGNWPGSPDNTTVFPQEMVVDYVRVFQ
ncbi:MAG: family 16 glycosylhydrolase [Bacteroidota bacterium]